jgi:hypothetical protein
MSLAAELLWVVIAFALFAPIVAVLLLGLIIELRQWNGGMSPGGRPWRLVETDSLRGRIYTDDCGRWCVIYCPLIG